MEDPPDHQSARRHVGVIDNLLATVFANLDTASPKTWRVALGYLAANAVRPPQPFASETERAAIIVALRAVGV